MEKLYSNENFSKSVVLNLRQLGYDVLTSFEAGKANQGIADPDVLAFAISEKRVLITINRRDFIKLHLLIQNILASLSAQKMIILKH